MPKVEPSKPEPDAGDAQESFSQYNAGDLIADKYKLVRRLGQGGMATVWTAKNTSLDVLVAIKLIRANTTAQGAAARLLQEARAAAGIDHPGIIRVFDFGSTARNEPFIVMELLEGESLAALLRHRARIDAVKAVQTMLPVADALASAHAKGVIHRDLKPDNIFLHCPESGRTQPKVLDFGIARLQKAVEHKLTAAGSILGSPAYMAPEQAVGSEDLDHRIDIWAFTVVLYEMMTGAPPFEASNYNALLRQILERDPVPTTQMAAGDAALWAIVSRGLHKDPDKRWQSIRSMGSALAQWLQKLGVDEDICGRKTASQWGSADDSGAHHHPRSLTSTDSGDRKSQADGWFDDLRSTTGSRKTPRGESIRFARTGEMPSAPDLQPQLIGHISGSGERPEIDFHTTNVTPGSLLPVDTGSRRPGKRRLVPAIAAVAVLAGLGIGALVVMRSRQSDPEGAVTPDPSAGGVASAASPARSAQDARSAPSASVSPPLTPVAVESSSASSPAVLDAGPAPVAPGKLRPAGSKSASEKPPKPPATTPGDDLKLPY
ncbi:MAG: serine/threonine protein kinase [Deltaproteobacteria bacterium]|nr:serine/threonine protein kinase [Deltaproteobacteria bacterium]